MNIQNKNIELVLNLLTKRISTERNQIDNYYKLIAEQNENINKKYQEYEEELTNINKIKKYIKLWIRMNTIGALIGIILVATFMFDATIISMLLSILFTLVVANVASKKIISKYRNHLYESYRQEILESNVKVMDYSHSINKHLVLKYDLENINREIEKLNYDKIGNSMNSKDIVQEISYSRDKIKTNSKKTR